MFLQVARSRTYVDPVQAVHSVLSGGLYEPDGHTSQMEALTPEYVPASQLAHASTPTLLLYLPAVHSPHPISDSRGAIPTAQSQVPQRGSVPGKPKSEGLEVMEATHQGERSWENASALVNMLSMVVHLEVSQPLMSWSNAEAKANMPYMLVHWELPAKLPSLGVVAT